LSNELPLTPSFEKRGKLLIIGSIAFDDIETPFGKVRHTLGGSATYISLSASFFAKPSVVAVVGSDFHLHHRKIFESKKIDLSGLKKTKGKTFTWGGKYGFDVNNRTTIFTRLNVFKNFKPKLTSLHKNCPYVFLGNIHPSLQLEVLKQIKKPKLAGLDTMNFWIESEKKALTEALKLVDIFVINESEARQLAKEHNLLKAARQILSLMNLSVNRIPPVLIIKQGEHGLLLFQERRILNLPGYLLEDVLDPTGAGDCFAGGLMGYLTKTNNVSWQNLKKACVFGSVVASFCVEKMGTKRLQDLRPRDIDQRFKEFKKLTHF